MDCIACGGHSFRTLLAGINADAPGAPRIPVLGCTQCGLAMSDRAAIAAAPEQLYFEGYYGEKAAASATGLLVRLFQRERQFHALRGASGGELLDVGCGDGTFLENLPPSWQPVGYEPSASGQNELRRKGISTVDVLSPAGPERKFDVITLWQSFEHVERGLELLCTLRGRVKPGGYLFVSVPNFASLQAQVFGARWFHLDPTRHLFHFRRSDLAAMLAKSGWRVERQTTFSLEYGVFGWWQSLFNVLPLEFNKGYKFLKARKRFDRSIANMAEALVYAILAIPFAAAAAALMGLETLFGRGGVIQVKAVPMP
jgi:2-polyprenyl-3-methyl-5-hydroxy-6-metoxy-1,4-benzoquinol methylase